MNWKTWMPLVLAGVMGIVAAKLGHDMIRRNRQAANANIKLAKVVVARSDLPPGKAITAADLALAEMPAQRVPQGAFTRVEDLAGRVVVAQLVKDQMIIDSLLARKGAGAGRQALVPDGMRAVTLEVNEFSGVGGLLSPGCRVDILSTLREEKSGKTVTRTIVENVRVTAVGQRMAPPKEGREGPETHVPKSVTLLVTPKEAEAIELAQNAGRTRLVLRGGSDNERTGGAGVTVADLVGEKGSDPTADLVAVAGPTHGSATSAQPTTQPAQLVAAGPTTAPATLIAERPIDPFVKRSVQIIRGGVETTVTFKLRRDEAPLTTAGAGE